MKFINTIFLLALVLLFQISVAQKPIINSVDKIKGAYGDLVTIKGNNFGTDASKLNVFFGPVSATIKSVSNQLVQVVVPTGAAFDNITITNTSTGLSSYSPSQFELSFGGTQGLTASNFAAEYQKASDLGLYDLALGDFNGDNLTDVVCTSDQFNSLAIMYNGSKPTLLNFTKSNSNLLSNIKTLHITTGDLNGDGRLDMVASEGNDGNRVILYKNNGNFNWGITAITLTGRKVKRVAIADLDLDGKPEIVVTDKTVNPLGNSIVSILPNKSTTSAFAFGDVVNLTIPAATSTDALEIKDMNGDGSPEIITSQFNVDVSNIFICSNKSTPGSFNLSDITTLSVSNSIVNVRIGDLDGDQKPDIVASRLLGSDIAIFRNTSTRTSFSFTSPTLLATSVRPWGLDLGDLDGDGKLDIAVCSIDNSIAKTISIYNNKSTSGNISFSNLLTINTTYINRHVKIGDMDGDAKPDIVYTSIDDNALGVPASKISIFRNTSCLIPTVTPSGPLTICTGYPLQLAATNSPGSQYSWTDGSNNLTPVTAQLDVTATGNYSVTVTSENGACIKTSNAVSITVSTASATLTGTPTPTSNSPICTGSALQLQINDVGAAEYRWTGPNSFTATGLTATPTIANFTSDNAGIYSVDIINGAPLAQGGCVAKTATLTIQNIDIPTFTTTFSGGSTLCQGTSKVLSVSPVLTSGFTYQWFNSAGALAGQTNSTLNVTATESYYVQVTSTQANCAPSQTSPTKITVLSLPVPTFTISPTPLCTGNELTFTNQSSVDANATATYAWTFGDNSTSALQNPKHTYTAAATYPIFLTVDYIGLTGCAVTTSKSFPVFAAVAPTITAATSGICAGGTNTLTVNGTFAAISWGTGSTGSPLTINQPGTYNVTTTDSNGCAGKAQITVALSPDPTLTVSADKTSVPPGQSVQLTASGADTYAWTPVESLSNPSIANPIATPAVSTTYTVKGTLTGGCSAQKTIDIQINSDLLTLKVTNVFTPNGDGHNDLWVIPGIEYYTDCTLTLYDKNGSRVFEEKGYKNDWDGMYKGQPAPEGTYYYVLLCTDKKPLTGSILLAR